MLVLSWFQPIDFWPMDFEASSSLLVAVNWVVFSLSMLKRIPSSIKFIVILQIFQSLVQSGVKSFISFVIAGGLMIFLPAVAARFRVLDFHFRPDHFGWFWNLGRPLRVIFLFSFVADGFWFFIGGMWILLRPTLRTVCCLSLPTLWIVSGKGLSVALRRFGYLPAG